MREIDVSQVTEVVAGLCMEANCRLGDDLMYALRRGKEAEESPLGREVFEQLLQNAELAREKQVPVCQDTGMAVIFMDVGQDVHFTGGNVEEAIQEGVRRGYQEGYLRKSVVRDPLDRVNTGDNTPAVIHWNIVPGNLVKITVAPKGFGSENMGGIAMLKPADGVEGVKKAVVDMVRKAGANPCPPVIVGVGLGGTMEKAAILAKKALLRPIGSHHPAPHIARLEDELLTAINRLGIGPQGFGGTQTALAVVIETFPTHIAGLPVAVNLNCHAARHMEAVL